MSAAPKTIGVLGSGDVGQILAKGFAKHGHNVMIGTRTVSKLDEFAKENPNIQVGLFSEVAAFGEDAVVLAVSGWAAMDCLKACGDDSALADKLCIDATNPLKKDGAMPPPGGVVEYFKPPGGHNSLMEALQSEYPKTHFVKGFNCVGNQYMIDPNFQGEKSTIFMCGNNAKAKLLAKELMESVGNKVEDFGPAAVAGPIESLCQLWCARGFNLGKWDHGFSVLTES